MVFVVNMCVCISMRGLPACNLTCCQVRGTRAAALVTCGEVPNQENVATRAHMQCYSASSVIMQQ